jgi:hypothetical protein
VRVLSGYGQTNALKQIKEAISVKALENYNTEWLTELTVDASSVGLDAVLGQRNPNKKDETRVIAYASKTLNDVERRYPQIDREALAVTWACEKFHLYIYASELTVFTYKTLQTILSKANSKMHARIERLRLRLSRYHFKIEHQPGRYNKADYLSRQPIMDDSDNTHERVEEHVNATAASIPNGLTQALILKLVAEMIRKVLYIKTI